MGCVSSALLEEGAEDDRRRIISHHHIVSLTSSTYGILTYTAPPIGTPGPPPPPQAAAAAPTTTASAPPPPPPPPPPPAAKSHPQPQPDEVINSWELMAGLLDPSTPARPPRPPSCSRGRGRRIRSPLRPIDGNAMQQRQASAVLYTTSLRGVRSTFEACNAVRAALQAHGVAFRERDVSMDRGFRDELRGLLRPYYDDRASLASGKAPSLPRLFVRGRHVGGADEVLRLDEQGLLAPLLEGLPRARGGAHCCCDGCGGMGFLPCFDCSGSRKVAVPVPCHQGAACRGRRTAMVVVRCGECNENGLVLCPICS